MGSEMMRLRALFCLFALALACVGCELFVVGTPARPRMIIERSQRTAAGVVHLFKAELDSGNTTAATELMVSASGRPLLAVEKYELADDLQRWKTVMSGQPISDTRIDTLGPEAHEVFITLDYIRKMNFSTVRRDGLWWVTKVTDPQRK